MIFDGEVGEDGRLWLGIGLPGECGHILLNLIASSCCGIPPRPSFRYGSLPGLAEGYGHGPLVGDLRLIDTFTLSVGSIGVIRTKTCPCLACFRLSRLYMEDEAPVLKPLLSGEK